VQLCCFFQNETTIICLLVISKKFDNLKWQLMTMMKVNRPMRVKLPNF